MRTQSQIEQYNKQITDAILISQMMDHPGFKVLKEYIEGKRNEIRYQDILGITPENLENQRGIALMIEDLLDYFTSQKVLADKPRIDPATGENEILNKKKNVTTRKRTNKA